MSSFMNPNWHWQPPHSPQSPNRLWEKVQRGHKPPLSKAERIAKLAKEVGASIPKDLSKLFD